MQLPLWQVLQKPTYWASNPPSIHETHSLLLSSVYLCPFYLLFFFYLGEFKHIRSSRGITAKHAIFAGTKRAIKDQGFPFLTKQEVNGLLQAEPARACGAHLSAIGVNWTATIPLVVSDWALHRWQKSPGAGWKGKNPGHDKGRTAIPAAACMYPRKLLNGSNQPESLQNIDTYLADVI